MFAGKGTSQEGATSLLLRCRFCGTRRDDVAGGDPVEEPLHDLSVNQPLHVVGLRPVGLNFDEAREPVRVGVPEFGSCLLTWGNGRLGGQGMIGCHGVATALSDLLSAGGFGGVARSLVGVLGRRVAGATP